MENNYYQQPVQSPIQQKPQMAGGALGKRHIFMGVCIFVANFIVPFINSLIVSLINSLMGTSSYYDYSSAFFGYALTDFVGIIFTVIKIAVYIIFAYLAYKSIRGVAVFTGVAFVATTFVNIITTAIQTVADLITALIISANPYSSDYAAALGARGVISSVLMFIGAVLAAAAGILLLMVVEKGKFNINLKKKKAAPAPAPVITNQTF